MGSTAKESGFIDPPRSDHRKTPGAPRAPEHLGLTGPNGRKLREQQTHGRDGVLP